MHALPWQVPLDGQVVHGTAQVSWSHISGEALPVRLSEGMEVPAGSLNLDGLLVVKALRGFDHSTPARIAPPYPTSAGKLLDFRYVQSGLATKVVMGF